MIPGLEIPPQYGYPLLTALLVVVAGYLVQRALKNRPGPPSIVEMWTRIQTLEAHQVASNQRERTALTEATEARAETAVARAETSELKAFIGEWISRLLSWDNGGRRGRMPLPSDADLTRLNITHEGETQ